MEREKQIALAHQRGETHIGKDAAKTLAEKRAAKIKKLQMLQQQQ